LIARLPGHLVLALSLLLLAPLSHADSRQLDVNLVVFDRGLDADPSQYKKLGIFPEIRELEARYLPFALRDALVATDQWGPVRVLPAADPESELLITGKIIHSDGISLEIAVHVVDSTGRVWLSQHYSETTAEANYTSNAIKQERPFVKLYQRFAQDLLNTAINLGQRNLQVIQNVSQLRYAHSLAPGAFSGYLSQQEDGRFVLLRLPAHNDPMLTRIERVREQEYVFVDSVDSQYEQLFRELGPTYDLWRQFNREQALYKSRYEDRLSEREKPKKGSYQAMKRSYLNFKWVKVQEQESARLAEGFGNETQPTFLELKGRVVELNGSLETQYLEWRRILRSIYELEGDV
jgi:hypothetical protein